ncbi:MAG: STAS domain-containing protein [Clostridia bacterium]|nr:STAS domain-containing protein [Clostridia bacterium]
MTIKKTLNNDALTLEIIGRLDTTTAPELETEIDQSLDNVSSLILDCGNLDYMSSAGLRVILKAQKIMNVKGEMKLINVSDIIMEIFDITGFSDILTIE